MRMARDREQRFPAGLALVSALYGRWGSVGGRPPCLPELQVCSVPFTIWGPQMSWELMSIVKQKVPRIHFTLVSLQITIGQTESPCRAWLARAQFWSFSLLGLREIYKDPMPSFFLEHTSQSPSHSCIFPFIRPQDILKAFPPQSRLHGVCWVLNRTLITVSDAQSFFPNTE